MMKPFEHIDADSSARAAALLGEGNQAAPSRPEDRPVRVIAGGTDLLTVMKDDIVSPQTLVNIKTVPDLDRIQFDKAAGLRLGPLVTLTDLEHDTLINDRYTALAQAAHLSASPQLRNMATIGGNLLQQSRCWYYRGPFHCWLKGGDECYAREGENKYHAILDQGHCITVNPSDPAQALIAFDATLHILGPSAQRDLKVEQFFINPTPQRRALNQLDDDELITAITMPTPPPDTHSVYLKMMDRQTWGFALVSVAARITWEGDRVARTDIILGGVAPTPYRATIAEQEITGHNRHELQSGLADRAAHNAMRDARPLEHNAYKAPLAAALIKRALLSL